MVDVCLLNDQAYTLTEWAGLTETACTSGGGVWLAYSNSLNALFQQYFAFDDSLFELVIGGSIVAYIVGHGTGAILKIMGRT